MVNILIVSHSFAVAQSICQLMNEMKQNNFLLEYLGGLEEGKIFGTDPIIISNKLTSLTESKDTLVFCDMGSSLLNTQMAIEFLPLNLQKKVLIAKSPFFEGILTAVVSNQEKTLLDDLDQILQNL